MCKDLSCGGIRNPNGACLGATIPYVVGPSCTEEGSCFSAEIGSVDLSCNGDGSCTGAQLSGVDLIYSCNRGYYSCQGAGGGDEDFNELIGCCNDEDEQCKDKNGLGIIRVGYCASVSVSHVCYFLSLFFVRRLISLITHEQPAPPCPQGYVNCAGGFVVVDGTTTDQSCAAACGDNCCTGGGACGVILYEPGGNIVERIDGGFTGKGKRVISVFVLFS